MSVIYKYPVQLNMNTNEVYVELPKNAKVFSGGEQQKVALARFMMRDYKISIFDEVTSAMDTESILIIFPPLAFNQTDIALNVPDTLAQIFHSFCRVFLPSSAKIFNSRCDVEVKPLAFNEIYGLDSITIMRWMIDRIISRICFHRFSLNFSKSSYCSTWQGSLLNSGILRIDPDNPDRCFTALIWGTEETAASDAVVVIFDTDRGAESCITGVNFNFVEIGYFNKHYRVIES